MAKKFRKIVVPPGTHHHRRGVEVLTPARIKRWVDVFRDMKSRGIKIPMPWGHQPKANPIEEVRLAEEEFYKSRYNATYLDDLEQGPSGELIAVAEAPPGFDVDEATGDLVNPTDGTRIGEVSLAARDWVSGDGTYWKDAIRHIAFTPLPVAHNTPGFEVALSTAAADDDGDLILGTTTLHSGLDLSTKPTRKGNKTMPATKTKPATTEDEPIDIMGEGEGDEGADEPKNLIDFDNPKPAGNGQDLVKELIPLLEQAGIHLTPDTDESNFLQHLKVALHAVKQREAPDEPEPEPGSANAPEPQEPVQEETPPLLMSTATAKTPAEQAYAAFIGKKVRADLNARIDKIEQFKDPASGLPFVRPARVQQFREEASGFEFSLTRDGEPVETELDRTLSLIEELAPALELSTAAAEEHVPPEKADAAAVDEIVGMISSPGPQKATS